jgi:hypothetical protein
MPMRPERTSRARRSVLEPLCAIGWLSVCLAGSPSGCLNPQPDDQPSERDTSSPTVPLVPPAATAPPPTGSGGVEVGSGNAGSPGPSEGFDNPSDMGVPPVADAGPPADAGPDAEPAVAP